MAKKEAKQAYVLEADRFGVSVVIDSGKRHAVVEDKVTGRTYAITQAKGVVEHLKQAIATAETVQLALGDNR